MTETSILYGVCGIGNGHTNRQLPIIEHYSQSAKIMIFAYGESLQTLSDRFGNHPNIKISEIAVPYYVSSKTGLDFLATLEHPFNQNIDFHGINIKAMSEAESFIGKPNVVISDYEPVSAQYAYATNSPLITIDQQSKYLKGSFPKELNGTTYADEVARLMMFFPKVEKRIACSFFSVPENGDVRADVEVVAPILKSSILNLQRNKSLRQSLLVYLSSQKDIDQPMEEMFDAFETNPDMDFNIFTKQDLSSIKIKARNINTYQHGDRRFSNVLSSCHGIISTAGHSLLSEAMFLGIPVYAIPLGLYEQQMNAHVIGENKFGIVVPSIISETVQSFIKGLPEFESNIANDKKVLLRQTKVEDFIGRIDSVIY
jgi:uncharacterized protein (TIGR00661 family)